MALQPPKSNRPQIVPTDLYWEDSVEEPTGPRKPITFRLDPCLVEQVDQYRKEHRWDTPYLCAFRSSFVETAVRFLLTVLQRQEARNQGMPKPPGLK